MDHQIFLGGACGRTTWRQQIAIPMLLDAGVTYYDPQLGYGEWTTAREAAEMQAKSDAAVLLFVISSETRGVATVGEIAYYIGNGRPLALVVDDFGLDVPADERDDLNRGRIFIRTMAKEHGVPVFSDVAAAVAHAIALVKKSDQLSMDDLRQILHDVHFPATLFEAEEISNGFLLQMRRTEPDSDTGEPVEFTGRKWFIDRAASPSAVVRTAFLAAVTWQEHEARHLFTYRGVEVFGPHFDVDQLARLAEEARTARTKHLDLCDAIQRLRKRSHQLED